MISYATITGTKRNLEALKDAGWRLFVTPFSCSWNVRDFNYAVDNGAWSFHQQGKSFNDERFLECVEKLGDKADFIVVPDIVCGGLASLELSLKWLPRLAKYRLVLIPVQDGMEWDHVRPFLSERVGIFLGGSTEWKLKTARYWGTLAREVGCYYHIGRVNSKRRIALCKDAGANSIDGTSASRFSMNVSTLDAAVRQEVLWKSGF